MLTNTASGGGTARWMLVACALIVPAAAYGANVNTTLTVKADVEANCTVSAGELNFGAVNPLSGSNVDGSSALTVTCTNGTPWSASAGLGSGSGASYTNRRLTSGANTLNYNLYTSSSYGTVWGDGTGTTGTISGTGSGSAQNNTIYGRIPSGQTTARTGNYTDSVSITVTY